MSDKEESIIFETDSGEKVSFFVVEETMLGGVNYLLVTDSEDDEAEAYILKEINDDSDQTIYEMVEDEDKLDALSKIFSELIDDVVIE